MTYMPDGTVTRAALLGVAIGAVYVLSPLTVAVVIGVCLLVAWAVRDIEGAERHWIVAILAAAILVRILGLVWLFIHHDHTWSQLARFVGDETYAKQRSLWMRNMWLGIPIGPTYLYYASDREYGWTGYHYVLACLQLFVGTAYFGVHALNAGLFVAAAVALHKVMRPIYGAVAACAGLFLLLFIPSLYIWSISALKESLQLFLTALSLLMFVRVVRGLDPPLRRIGLACTLVLALLAVNTIRVGALPIIAVGLAGGFVGWLATFPKRTIGVAAVLVAVFMGFVAYRVDVESRLMNEIHHAAAIHHGHVNTHGHAYKLLDQRFYSDGPLSTAVLPTMTRIEATRFVIRGMVAFITVPMPWDVVTKPELIFIPQQVLWYGLVLLGTIGAIEGLRRDPLVTGFLVAYLAFSGAVITLNGGNVGTLVRLRDTAVPFLVWLSAVGGVAIVTRVAPHVPVATPLVDWSHGHPQCLS